MELGRSAGEIIVTIKPDTSELHRALGKIEGHLESIEARIDRINKKAAGGVVEELQLTAHKLDHIREPVLAQDRGMIERKIRMLKESDGEGWAIGEAVERILDIDYTERECCY